MKSRTGKKESPQPIRYHIYATLGRWLYRLKLKLEGINEYLDKKADDHWIEQ